MLTSTLLAILATLKSHTPSTADLHTYVNYNDPRFQRTAIVAVLCPLIWNILARFCRTFTLDKSKSFQLGVCYALTVWIFGFSSYRDYLFHLTLGSQPTYPFFVQHYNLLQPLAIALIAAGQVFVLSSFYKLGITGTFLGDYCGILMDAPVTTFPFNVLSDPMYVGASMSFLGSSLYNQSLAGVVLTTWIYVIYQVALAFEGPYTTMIYKEAAQKKQKRQA